MRHGLHILTTILSCCFFSFIQGCISEKVAPDQPRSDVQNNKIGDKISVSIPVDSDDNGDQNDPLSVAPVPTPAPLVPDLPPPPPPIVPLPPWLGGGDEDFPRGNHDDHFRPIPEGYCGDGIQEAFPNRFHCPYKIYGVATVDGVSSLYGFNLASDGAGNLIGPISSNIASVQAIDFAPDGVLYGVGIEVAGGFSVLMTIDCRNGDATVIGRTNVETTYSGSSTFLDIDFDSFGRLWAYIENDADYPVGLFAPSTGNLVPIGLSGIEDLGGLGSIPFPNDILYHAGSTNVYTINKATGVATIGSALVFSPPAAGENPLIDAMDADFITNIMYVSVDARTTENYYVGTLNIPGGSTVSFLSSPPPLAPTGLNALAVSQRYEECDPLAATPVLPAGTTCIDCILEETDCSDGIDNNGNGLIDCADPSCLGLTCSDDNGCSTGDVCVLGSCVGIAVNCTDIVGNECTTDTCISTGATTFYCESVLNTDKETFGSCTPSNNCRVERNPDGTCPEFEVFNHCEVGKCAQLTCSEEGLPPEISCEAAFKDLVPIEEGGCLTDNPCITAGCYHFDGHCRHDFLDNVLCYDGNPCTKNDTCTIAEDQLSVACLGTNVPATCIVDTDCGFEGICIGAVAGHCSASGFPCFSDDNCSGGSDACTDPVPILGGCDCAYPANLCTYGACNGSGMCEQGIAIGACVTDIDCPSGLCSGGFCGCSDGNTCTTDICAAGLDLCVRTPLTDGDACTVDPCSAGTCEDGACVDLTPDNALCIIDDCTNFCVESTCTETGCENILLDGVGIPCSFVVDDVTCEGLVNCVDGVEGEAGCVLLPDQPDACNT